MHRAWGYTLPWIPMPVVLMRPMAKMAEAVGSVLNFKPTFTTQAINYSGCAHYYSCEKAVKLLGYQPPIDLSEAIKRSLNHYWGLRNTKMDDLRDKEGTIMLSKAQQMNIGVASLFSMSPVRAVFFFVLSILLLMLGAPKLGFYLLLFTIVYAFYIFRDGFLEPVRMYSHSTSVVPPNSTPKKRVFLVTGANRGLGFHTCMELLRLDVCSELILACRDSSKGSDALVALKKAYPNSQTTLSLLPLDLCSFDSVQSAAKSLRERKVSIEVLIHNAGGMMPHAKTSNGFDQQFQGNFLSSVLFTNILLKDSSLAPAAKIVCVSSMMHRLAQTINLKNIAQPTNFSVLMYCRTKLLQIVWAAELQRRFNQEANEARLNSFGTTSSSSVPLMDRRTIVCVNPGAVATEFIHYFLPVSLAGLVSPLLNSIIQRTPIQGVQGILYACLSEEMSNVGGVYLDNSRTILPSQMARDQNLQEIVYKQVQAWTAKEM